MITDVCYPRLFERTFEMTDVLNNHTRAMMSRIADIIRNPTARDSSPNCTVDDAASPTRISCTKVPAAGTFTGYPLTLTWQKSAGAAGATQYETHVYIQAASTAAANVHQCELGVTPAPTAGACSGSTCPTCTTIFSSTLNVTPTANGFDVSSPAGTPVLFDFTSLNTVDPNERATGTFQVNVQFTKDTTKPNPFRRVLGFTFSNFVPALTATEMAAGMANHGARSGTLAHVGYTGSGGGGGGAMEFVDEVVLFCPAAGQTAPPSLYSDALTVGRWYLDPATTPSTLYARVDAEAVGDAGGATPAGAGGGNAQLPSGTTFLGASCYSSGGAVMGGMLPANDSANPWMFAEVTGGTNVTAGSYRCGPSAAGTCASTCGASKLVPAVLPTVTGTTLNDPYSFNGLSPNVASSGIPTDPATITTALAPLLCGTGVGTAWTGQPNCP
jgi:hypothetical protein